MEFIQKKYLPCSNRERNFNAIIQNHLIQILGSTNMYANHLSVFFV